VKIIQLELTVKEMAAVAKGLAMLIEQGAAEAVSGGGGGGGLQAFRHDADSAGLKVMAASAGIIAEAVPGARA
jgi:hypothetical protein